MVEPVIVSGIFTSEIPTMQLARGSIGRYFRLLLSLLDSSISSGKPGCEEVWLLVDSDDEIVKLLALQNCDDRWVGRLHLGARRPEEGERKTENYLDLEESYKDLPSQSDDCGKGKQTTGEEYCSGRCHMTLDVREDENR